MLPRELYRTGTWNCGEPLSVNNCTFQAYRLPLREAYIWAKGVQSERSGIIILLDLYGFRGIGEVAPPPHEIVDRTKFFGEAREKLASIDFESDRFLSMLDLANLNSRLRCGVSSAWCSAMAAQKGVNLSKFLAGEERTPAVKVPVNALITAENFDSISREVNSAISQGITTVKVKCTGNSELDLARVQTVRDQSKDLKIRLDPNGKWSEADALSRLEEFAPIGIEYCEQPIPPSASLDALKKLKSLSPIKIALDESATDLQTIKRLLSEGAASHLILKPQRLGGPDKVYAAIKLAEAFGVGTTVTGSLETVVGTTVALHCAALIKPPIPAAGIGTGRYFARDIGPQLPIENGEITVPAEPGL